MHPTNIQNVPITSCVLPIHSTSAKGKPQGRDSVLMKGTEAGARKKWMQERYCVLLLYNMEAKENPKTQNKNRNKKPFIIYLFCEPEDENHILAYAKQVLHP